MDRAREAYGHYRNLYNYGLSQPHTNTSSKNTTPRATSSKNTSSKDMKTKSTNHESVPVRMAYHAPSGYLIPAPEEPLSDTL